MTNNKTFKYTDMQKEINKANPTAGYSASLTAAPTDLSTLKSGTKSLKVVRMGGGP